MTSSHENKGGTNTMTSFYVNRCQDDRKRRYINRLIALASSGAIIGSAFGVPGATIGAGIGVISGLTARGKLAKLLFGEELDDTCLDND
ncbi:MAG: hypothetical protein AB4063_21755 [Crocosphaera sp.]